jgi:calmodulin
MRSLGLNPTNKELNEIMLEIDENGSEHVTPSSSIFSVFHFSGNQRIDFTEFAKYMSQHGQERDQEAELREAFRIFDRDNSGYITISELKQVSFSHWSLSLASL